MLHTASLNHIPWHMLQVYLYSCPPMIQWRDVTQTWQEKSGSYSYMYGHWLTSIFLPNPSAKSTIWAYREREREREEDTSWIIIAIVIQRWLTDWLTDHESEFVYVQSILQPLMHDTHQTWEKKKSTEWREYKVIQQPCRSCTHIHIQCTHTSKIIQDDMLLNDMEMVVALLPDNLCGKCSITGYTFH